MVASFERRPGMDHDIYPYQVDTDRRDWRLPGGASIALYVLLHIEHWELHPPSGSYRDPRFTGVYGDFAPDYWRWSYRLYGNRVGIHRIMRLLDDFAIPATVAINSMAVDHHPDLIDEVARRTDWEPVAHGLSASRMISGAMSEAEERDHLAQARAMIAEAFGTAPRGWAAQDYGASERTSRLLAELGFSYTLDWPNDERPYRQLSDSRLVAVPSNPDFDDVQTLWLRRLPVWDFPSLVSEALRVLSQSRPRGRVFGLGLHPWMIGAAHRIAYLRDILARLRERDDLWFATAGQIADHYTAFFPIEKEV